MRPERFVDHTYGAPYRDPASGWSFWAFRPASIPRDLRLDPETVLALSEADAALGRLAGAGRHLPDPSVVVRPYIMREALASSRIEGTQASLSDVFQAVAAEEESPNPDILEVFNYMRAMDYGLGLAPNLPLVGRMVREIHEQLVTGVRGEGRRPGEFRREPVWIGSPTDDPETATFVPPLPAELNAAWSDWEAFANEGPRLPHLVQCALMHYQFETIHPFFDGNGRLGRLLIVFFLIIALHCPPHCSTSARTSRIVEASTTTASRPLGSAARCRSGCSSSSRPLPCRPRPQSFKLRNFTIFGSATGMRWPAPEAGQSKSSTSSSGTRSSL